VDGELLQSLAAQSIEPRIADALAFAEANLVLPAAAPSYRSRFGRFLGVVGVRA
jgi:hypothetical protein